MNNRSLPPGRRPAAAPRPQPWSQGASDRVPCPSCGKPNSMVELDSQQLLDTGHRVDCMHCHRMMEVVAIRVVKVVAVRPWDAQSGAASRARQATTIGPAQLSRLLKG